ncbi:hypothetical protein SLA2020_289990 [Shorea laevis]
MDKSVEETGKGFDCLVTDAFYWFGADLAEELQVPWLPLWIAGPRSLFLHLETDKIRQYIKSYGSKEKTLDLFPEFSAIRACDLQPEITSENMDDPFTVMLHKLGLELPRASAIVGDSYEELDTTIVNMLRSRIQKYLPVDPLFLTSQPPSFVDPHGCLERLNKHQTASVVYIGFGTALKPPPHELVALAEAMEEMGLPYLWSLKGEPEQELPRAFVERTREKGKIVAWTPQRQVLEHPSVGVHVTHGGWKSVMESILGGVPLICRPFFADNQLNSLTVEAVWGIGLTVEGGVFTKQGTLKALNSILFDEEGKKIRKKIEIHKELVHKTVEPNGSSTENFNTLVKIIREH